MDLDSSIENNIKNIVISYYEKGRSDWDIPHVLASVHWMKELLKKEQGNPRILIPAVYLHDIGYSDLFSIQNPSPEDIKRVKEQHMARGAEIAGKILSSLNEFSDEEIKRIKHLIAMHDDLENINEPDEQLLFEADSLGQIDRDRVKPTFSREDAIKTLERFEKNRASRFKTNSGRKYLLVLLRKARDYLSALS